MIFCNFPLQSNSIICPQITVWIIFVLELLSLLILEVSSSLLAIVDQLVISISVTLGIMKRNFCLYKCGLIISIIGSILETFSLIYIWYSLVYTEKESYNGDSKISKGFIILILVVAGNLIWIQSCVLCWFRNIVRSYCGGLNFSQMQSTNFFSI